MVGSSSLGCALSQQRLSAQVMQARQMSIFRRPWTWCHITGDLHGTWHFALRPCLEGLENQGLLPSLKQSC